MTNHEIALILNKIAFFLELKSENNFKIKAYQTAARHIEDNEVPIEEMLLAGERLTSIKGVGKIIAKKIEELIILGELRLWIELKTEFPESLYEISKIKGIGPKTIHKLYAVHGITSLPVLRDFINQGGKLDIPPVMQKKILQYIKK